VIWIMWRVS